jgi:SAM-dependent methyltransferase
VIPLTSGRAYRDRIYGRYVSGFKGSLAGDELAEALERRGRFLDHLMQPVLERAGTSAWLEVGCGGGHFLHWAARRGIAPLHGFDVSSEQVAAARALGLPAEVADYRPYLSRHHEAFDLVVGLDLIEHLGRDEVFEFLDLCHDALRPGGYLFLTTPNGAGIRPGPVAHGDLTHETIFTPQTIALALRLTGYDEPEIREIAPPPTSARSRVRGVIWKAVRAVAMAVDLVETGAAGRVYSRVMSVLARRPPPSTTRQTG